MKTALSVVMALLLAGLLLFFALAPAQIERGMNIIQPGPEPEISSAALALHSELFIVLLELFFTILPFVTSLATPLLLTADFL